MQPREPILSSHSAFNEQLLLLEHVNNDAVFYSGKQHGKHLDLLLHLSRYSNLLLTVTGQEGSGKTHLKNRMLQQLDSGVLVSQIDAKKTSSAGQLLPSLSEKLNIEIPAKADFDFYIDEIRNFSSLLNEDGGSCLIVIDNADQLEQDAINLILELATTSSDSHRPHIALFGHQELFDKLNKPENITRFETVGHHLPLEAFNESETKAYLEHRCTSVGIDQLPINNQQLLNIFRTAKGLPGLLNKALVEELRQSTGQPAPSKTNKAPAKKIKTPTKLPAKIKKPKAVKPAEKRKKSIWPLFFTASTIALVVVGYIYKDQFISSSTLDTSLISRSHEIRQSDEAWQPPPVSAEQNTPLEQAIEPEEVAETPIETLIDLPDDTPTGVVAPKVAVEAPKKPTVTPKTVAKAPAKKATWVDTGARREATLMKKSADRFTLQMMGSLDESSVKSFIQVQTTNRASFSYFEGRYKGQPWYVVVYGDYADRDQALAAIQNLPETLQKQRPWARNYLSVQEDIRSR